MNKTQNNRAWWLVVPVLVLVAFNAFIPLMTVVNYAFQETFGDNVFFWEGTTWFEQVLRSPRFHASLIRQLVFTGMILAIEMVQDKAARTAYPWQERRGLRVYEYALEQCVLLRPLGNVIYFMPPYVITPEEIGLLGRVAAEGIDLATRD